MKKTKTDLIIRTVNKYGWHQFIAVNIMILAAIGIIVLVLIGAGDPEENPVWGYLVALGCLAGAFVFLQNYARWPKEILKAEISGSLVRGKNIYGKEISFDILDIVRIADRKKLDRIEFVTTNDETFSFSAAIDFSGFLYDYILQMNPGISFPAELEKKAREDLEFWAYTRRAPFNAKYPGGYLKTFWPILLEQQERLVAKGVLKKDVCYGDKNDPFLNPDSFMGKLDRWIEDAEEEKQKAAKKKKKDTGQ